MIYHCRESYWSLVPNQTYCYNFETRWHDFFSSLWGCQWNFNTTISWSSTMELFLIFSLLREMWFSKSSCMQVVLQHFCQNVMAKGLQSSNSKLHLACCLCPSGITPINWKWVYSKFNFRVTMIIWILHIRTQLKVLPFFWYVLMSSSVSRTLVGIH